MAISRRNLLKILLVTAGGAVAVAAGFRRPLRDVYHRFVVPVLDETPTGSLSDQTLKTLLATTEAFIGYPVESRHYEDFFRWHSETLPGYKTLYERFTETVDRSARRSSGCGFAECESATRRKILEPAFQVHRARRLDKVRLGVFEREWRLIDLHIFQPITALFANTDAWRLVGYDAWPGTPRGLERYTQPPPGVR